MSTSPAAAQPDVSKHLTSQILLWVRTDQPRQTGMDDWNGPHSGIISATPGLEEYRQIHLAERNPGLWPTTGGVQTAIPVDRKIPRQGTNKDTADAAAVLVGRWGWGWPARRAGIGQHVGVRGDPERAGASVGARRPVGCDSLPSGAARTRRRGNARFLDASQPFESHG